MKVMENFTQLVNAITKQGNRFHYIQNLESNKPLLIINLKTPH